MTAVVQEKMGRKKKTNFLIILSCMQFCFDLSRLFIFPRFEKGEGNAMIKYTRPILSDLPNIDTKIYAYYVNVLCTITVF